MAAAALAAAEPRGDPSALVIPLYMIWATYLYAGNCRAAQETADRLLRVALQVGDADAIVMADRAVSVALLFGGSQRDARARLARRLERYVAPQPRQYTRWSQYDHHLLARALVATAMWLEGVTDQATAEVEACLRESSGRDERFTHCEVLRGTACRIRIMNGDFAAAEQGLAKLIEIATANGFRQYQQSARCLEGMLLIKRGEHDRGTAALRDGLDDCSATGWTTFFPEFLGVLAEGLGGLGQAEAGRDTVAQALARAEQDGERWYVPELLRIKGELLLLQPSGESVLSAEQCFHEALAVAREQGALSWELRAASSLARLKASRDRPDEARDVLAPVYARFTEGFATADLRAARALLDGLTPRR